MNRIELSYKQALESLREIVKGKEDFIYNSPGRGCNAAQCFYFHDGKPSCIIGHLLARHGLESLVGGGGNSASVAVLVAAETLVVDPRTRVLLSTVQDHQDQNYTWGESLQAGIDEVARQYMVGQL